MCMGSFLKSTNTLGLEIILNFLPLDILAKEEARKAAYKISGQNPVQWDEIGTSNRHSHLFHNHKDWRDLDRIPKTYLWSRQNADWDSFDSGTPEEPDGTVICYTNGSQITENEAKGDGLDPEEENPPQEAVKPNST